MPPYKTWQMERKLTGFDEVVKRLGGFTKRGKIMVIVRKGMTPVTKRVYDRVKARVPKDTGLLRQSMWRNMKTYRRRFVVIGYVGPRMDLTPAQKRKQAKLRRWSRSQGRHILPEPFRYAHHVEFGTVRQRAQPFIRPAWNGAKSSLRNAFDRKVTEEVAREIRNSG
jgi:HK97 gp10 family phage protein